MLIQFGPFAPDIADINTTVSATAKNVLPAANSYLPFPSLSTVTSAVNATPLGGFLAVSSDGAAVVFAGTAESLYQLQSDLTWKNVSKGAAGYFVPVGLGTLIPGDARPYHASDAEPWRFAQFGDYVVAVNANDPPQVFDLGGSTEFANLGGSPPQSRLVAVWGDFLVLANQANDPNKLQWSGLNDITNWTVGTGNSDEQVFPDGGAILGMSSGNMPIIVQEKSIRRGTFQPGSDIVFTFDKVLDKVGARSASAVASRDNLVFFVADDGFYQVDLSGGLNPIGLEKVNRYFLTRINPDWKSKVRAEVDPVNSRVYFTFKSVDAPSNAANSILIYDWRLQKWTEAEQSNYGLLAAATPGFTLESLSAIYPDIDAITTTLDSAVWSGGSPVIGGFDTNGGLGFFTGSNAAAVLETPVYGDTAGGVMWAIDPAAQVGTLDYSIAVKSTLRRSDATNYGPEKRPSTNTGRVRNRVRGRYHKVRVSIDAGADWDHIASVDIGTAPGGMR